VKFERRNAGRWSLAGAVLAVCLLAAAGATAAAHSSSAPASSSKAPAPSFGEHYTPSATIMRRAMGTTQNVPPVFLAALYRAQQPLSAATVKLALKCWKDNVCNTGTGGKLTVGMVDGFGENVWRQVTHMEFVLQALTYPQIGKIIYSSARLDAQKSISDIRSLVAQKANVIIGFPDFGNAVLPAVKEATARGIPFITYASGIIGTPGKDYLGYVGEDLCSVGKKFASIINGKVSSGAVAFLGGTPGNPLSAGWQACEKPALASNLTFAGDAATNWTREGSQQAMSGFLSKYPDLAAVSYEYADGFLGALTAYENAHKPVNLVATIQTDETGLFCEWKKINNPNFKLYHGYGRNFQSRVALTAGMMKLAGAKVPAQSIMPFLMRPTTANDCNTTIPSQASISSLVPANVMALMYRK
jgi:ribose transport system substrate-binding protein